ncbi:MAG TPA: polysaccharide export protein EpsE [Steroidobacteraceae bacterium]
MSQKARSTALASFGRARPAALLLSLALGIASGTAPAESREQLGPGDTVRVTVFQNPELGGELRLTERGSVVLPLVGEVVIAGQTPVEAGVTIAARFARGRFLVDPHVSVALVDVRSRQVSVLGQVLRPGQYPIDHPGLRLTDVLALAGGIAASGDSRIVAIVTRDGGQRRLEIDVAAMYRSGDMSPNFEVQAGDAIFVPEAPVFYVHGEVQRAGAYKLGPETSVMSALAMGGGLTPRGTYRGLTIHRRMPDGTVRKLSAKPGDPVLAGDVIQVKEGLF